MLQNNYVRLYKLVHMKKSARLGLVLTPVEKNALTILAAERGNLSKSALIRCLIHEAAQATGLLNAAHNQASIVRKVFVLLEAEEITALEKLAEQEHRDMRQQAAAIIRRELEQLNLV